MRRALILSAITATALLQTGCPNPETLHARNVVLIVVDTLRRDHLGAYGYARETSPAIDALAADGVRFDRAYATSGWTMPSVASMLTGLYPSAHGVVRPHTALSAEVPTLAGILRARGFATAGVVSHRVLGKTWGISRGFEWFDESHVKGHVGLSTDGVTTTAISMLDRLSAGDAPFFLFAHYFDPHYAYQPHPEFGFSPSEAGRLRGGERIGELRALGPDMSEAELEFVRSLYDGEIRYTDAGIGRLLDRLKALGRYDDTLILLVADHGEEFFERGWLGHTTTLYDELVRVPLILRRPQPTARSVIDEPVSLTSLAPTIMELLGLEIPEGFPHPSIAGQLDAAPDAPAGALLSEVDFVPVSLFNVEKTVSKSSLIGPRFKLIRDWRTQQTELYDLVDDPNERNDLAASDPERVAELTLRLDELLAEVRSRRGVERPRQLSDKEIEELRALGYGE